MQTPLNASASSAGALISGSTFDVPQFQREYSWQEDEVAEFWSDLQGNIDSDAYFLGLVILTDEENRKHVVDGQQRLITISLLAAAIYHEATKRGRQALADRIRADFLHSINYDTDETDPRIRLSDQSDDKTLQTILSTGEPLTDIGDDGSVSQLMVQSYQYLSRKLSDDLKVDPFKRLGKWTEFLTNRVYFAVFVHPDSASAYQVYEVINTRGKELTTADLLKNYVLSQTAARKRENRYKQWQAISRHFTADSSNTFVQYIRHAVTVQSGHVLPKDLFGFLAQRVPSSGRRPPTPDDLMELLEDYLPLYTQMMDPTLAGPAEPEALNIFAALNSLGVIAVRPILLAVANVPNSLDGMKYVLRLVVRRIVVGNLGTGNVERRFGEAAKKVHDKCDWNVLADDLKDLNPTPQGFVEQLRKRSLNKRVLAFLRRSVLKKSITPDADGILHFVWNRQGSDWTGMGEEDGAFWASTLGNTFFSELHRRPKGATDWEGFKEYMLPHALEDEWRPELEAVEDWNAAAVEEMGERLAKVAGNIWYQ